MPRPIFELVTTKDQEHELHRTAFDAKPSTKTVRVDAAALRNLLIDHGKAIQRCSGEIKRPSGEPAA